MKNRKAVRTNQIMAVAAFLLLAGNLTQARAQTPSPQTPVEPIPPQASQALQVPDVERLRFTPEQIQKIRAINAELRDQQQAAKQRLRQAQRALAEAVESPNPGEALIEQRARELSEAQAAHIRLRALREARILQIMTPEQRETLRQMREEARLQNQLQRRQQRIENGRQRAGGRPNALPRNGKPGPKVGLGANKLPSPKLRP